MAQTKTPSKVQQLRESHQALAKSAAESGVTPPAFEDDPTFRDLVASHTLSKEPDRA